MAAIRWLASLLLLCGGCSGCYQAVEHFSGVALQQNRIELKETAFFPQDQYQCGPAALATLLQSSGVSIQPPELIAKIYLPERHGSLQTEIISTSRIYGRLAYIIRPDINALIDELQAGYPVLVLQNLGLTLLPVWHYAVVIGYIPESSEIILRSGTTRRASMTIGHFMKTWAASDNWGLIILKPTQLPADKDAIRYLKAVADLEETGQHDASLTGYQTAVARWPENPTAWFGLGNGFYLNKSFDAAEDAYQQTLKLEPNHLPALNNLAMTLARLKRKKAALDLINKTLINISPQSPMHQTLLQTREAIINKQP